MKNNLQHTCRICEKIDLTESYYPEAHFNNKVFKYYKCNSCQSYNVFPSPNEDDFNKMYGENDHTYLKEISGKLEYNFNFPFADHQGYQIEFLKQIKDDIQGKILLDYACGSGFYMHYAQKLGAKAVGVEFDEQFVNVLKSKTNLDIYTFQNLHEQFKGKTFDYIHLGHVLEHLSAPLELIYQLKEFTHKDTLFIVDGPLERNHCLHRFYVDFGSRLKGKKYRNSIPQHLTLTTQKSQLTFFKQAGLKKDKYIVTEQYFPLPFKLEKSIGKIVSYLIATASILLSKAIPSSGNIFHYRGKIDLKNK